MLRVSHYALPECEWRDALALLDRTFRRCRFSAKEVEGLMAHVAVIGDDLEGWGLLDEEVTPGELADGIIGAIASDLYSLGDDDTPMRMTVYAAVGAWVERVTMALAEERAEA